MPKAAPPAAEDRSVCTACRGTGRLISGLGGSPHDLSCPWCEGSGRFISGHDAQEKPAELGQGPDKPAPGPEA